MTNAVEPYVSKARESLSGALSEMANGRYNNAANRAYYAAYQAAIVALVQAGLQTRSNQWGHDEVRARFAELIERRKLYPGEFRRMLYDLSEVRLNADYGETVIGERKANAAVNTADRFIRRVLR
jgi:uncharacterized protein (UPF0332 family)